MVYLILAIILIIILDAFNSYLSHKSPTDKFYTIAMTIEISLYTVGLGLLLNMEEMLLYTAIFWAFIRLLHMFLGFLVSKLYY